MTRLLAMICIAAIFSIGLTAASIHAQDTELRRGSLQGINAISVEIESLSDGAKLLGLSKDDIRTDVELKLRLAGIRVVTEKEVIGLPGMPSLYVMATVTESGKAVSINVQLVQNVHLERNGQLAVGATTWDVGAVGVNLTAQDIRDKIKDLVDTFVNAWLSVNPKK